MFEHYQRVLPRTRLKQLLAGHSAFSRQGPLSAWIVIWLIIFQRLHPVGTLAVAVCELLTGPVKKFIRWTGRPAHCLSANTSAYSQARSRLPLPVAERATDLIFEGLFDPQGSSGLDMPVFLLDGSSVQTRHSQELVSAFPPARNRWGESHWPVIRVLVAHEMTSGLALRPEWGPMYGPQAVSEQGLAKRLMSRMPAGSGALADRNFGVFSMAYHAHLHNHPGLFRLTKLRAQKLNARVLPRSGTDKPICWTPTRDDLRTNPEIPSTASLQGRLLAFRLKLGRKTQKIYFFTTFHLPAQQILDLYGYRWYIETDLRWLKRQVRLNLIDAGSKAMVEKELVLAVAAYNLTRAVMNQAASALGTDPRQLSYSLAQNIVHAFLPLLASAKTTREHKRIFQNMLHLFSHSRLPRRRKRRAPPRAVWPRTCPFPKRKAANKHSVSSTRKKVA